jgi:hypothetical protein
MKLRNKIITNIIANIRVSIERLLDFISNYTTEKDKETYMGVAGELDILDSESHHPHNN